MPYEGNLRALEVMAEVFELRPHFEWRGLGFISQSALQLSDAYADLDAELRFERARRARRRPEGVPVRRGAQGRDQAVGVQGLRHAPARRSTPIGTCMVSPEGACAAYYNYGRFAREREVV